MRRVLWGLWVVAVLTLASFHEPAPEPTCVEIRVPVSFNPSDTMTVCMRGGAPSDV